MTAAAVTPNLLPRLLSGVGERPMVALDEHVAVHGPQPDVRRTSPERLIEIVEAAGLRGHGGASFPMGRKLRAVAARRRQAVVVANGAEGEPASKKDRALLREVPHLVLDGAAAAARAVGAREAIVAVATDDERSIHNLGMALRERTGARMKTDPKFDLVGLEPGYLAGQESALVASLNGGAAKPTFGPRPFERGIGRRPTLVHNVETLAHMALIVRHGPGWFRELGTSRDPGSALITLSGAVAGPGVYEIEQGMPLIELLESAGVRESLAAVLVGGYFGTWLPARAVPGVRLDGESLAEHGATLGAGVVVALGPDACPVAETSAVAEFFAAESAGQCGPCVHGLDAIASTVHQLGTGNAAPTAWSDLERWTRDLHRRGVCQHPDGAVRFISSALRTFEPEFRDHARRGPCDRCAGPGVLPAPIRERRRR
ncbi:MAG TPA: NADH-ubiquinone oxidoreductase-F iron-sulfur binding region domain-containing protein [Solirubrobacteraceae bacterium]|nr:NADH-ubiquinone oxidoreductase-F iron-sulfur binding region domain-containing protein [Solirubrobacteraceae bacterium]